MERDMLHKQSKLIMFQAFGQFSSSYLFHVYVITIKFLEVIIFHKFHKLNFSVSLSVVIRFLDLIALTVRNGTCYINKVNWLVQYKALGEFPSSLPYHVYVITHSSVLLGGHHHSSSLALHACNNLFIFLTSSPGILPLIISMSMD